MARTRVKVKFSGALYNNRHTFQASANKLTQKARKAVLTAAKMYEDSMRTMLGEGSDIWNIPDTPYYRRKKAWYQQKHGLPETGPWIKSGELVSHLTHGITQDGSKRRRAWAGFEEGNHSSGRKVSEMVDWLDNDFPLIEPAWERVKPEVMDILLDIGNGIFRDERG